MTTAQEAIDALAAKQGIADSVTPTNLSVTLQDLLNNEGGIIPIYSAANIPTPGGIPTLLAGKAYQIQEAMQWPAGGVVFEDRAALIDLNILNNTLTMSGTGTMMHGVGSAFLYGLVLDAPDGGQLYDFDDPVGGEKSIIIESNQNLTCGKVGTFNDHAVTVLDLFRVQDCDEGLTFTGANKFVHSISRAAITTTVGAGFVAVDQTDMKTVFLEYDLHVMSGPAGSVAYSGLPNSGNIQPGNVANVIGNDIIGGMTTLQGLDDDDVGYRFVGTSQVKDSTLFGSGYITTSATTVILSGVEVVLAGTYTQSGVATQADIDAAGTIKAKNIVPTRAVATAIAVIDHVGGGADSYLFEIQKNEGGLGAWVGIPESSIQKTFQGAETNTIVITGPTECVAGDEFRIVVTGILTGDDIVADNCSFTLQKI